MIRPLHPVDGATVTLLREEHLRYIRDPQNDPNVKVDWLNLKATGTDLSFPEPLELVFEPAQDAELVLRSRRSGARVLTAQNGRAETINLFVGETYEWFVRTPEGESEIFTFQTDPTPPRMLFVEGISNVRDFGGFHTVNGVNVKQGMVYRTSEMDTHTAITPRGIETLEKELGIRTDMDLRGIKQEPVGPVLDPAQVKWVNYPIAAYADIYTPEQMELYRRSFALMAEPETYPVMVHCWGGIDRTGTWLYLLGAILGVSEDDLGLDYEMSTFSRWGRRSRRSEQFCAFLDGLKPYGDDIHTAAVGFLHACGVSDETLDRIRAILLEK